MPQPLIWPPVPEFPGDPRLGNLYLSRRGNKKLKRVLFLSALAALHHPPLRAYYDRKRAEGKRHNQTIIALARRHSHVLFTMLRGEPLYADLAEPRFNGLTKTINASPCAPPILPLLTDRNGLLSFQSRLSWQLCAPQGPAPSDFGYWPHVGGYQKPFLWSSAPEPLSFRRRDL